MAERNQRAPAAGKTESILAAAKQCFLARGFGAVSMDAIAAAAGASKATVYAHFAGKDELFGAVIARECERASAGFTGRELDAGAVHASLTTLGRRFLQLILSPDAIALHRIIVGEVARFPSLGQVFYRAGPERNLGQIEAFLRRAGDAGALRLGDHPRRAAEQFVALVRGEVQLRQLLRLDPPADAAAIDAAVHGALATFLAAYETRRG